jgi:hypothetical protein
MRLFQMIVFIAVLFGNIHFEWIKNGYAATLGAAIVTYYGTLLLVKAIEAGFLGQRASRRLSRTVSRLERDLAARNSGLAKSGPE